MFAPFIILTENMKSSSFNRNCIALNSLVLKTLGLKGNQVLPSGLLER